MSDYNDDVEDRDDDGDNGNGEAVADAKVQLVVGMVDAKFINIPAEGTTLRNLPGYSNSMAYTVSGVRQDPDAVILPGAILFAAKAYSNG